MSTRATRRIRWILAGLVGYPMTFLTGILFLSPRSKRIAKLLVTKGAADPETQAYQCEVNTFVSSTKTIVRIATASPTRTVTTPDARRSSRVWAVDSVSMAPSKGDATDGYKPRAASISTSRSGSSSFA
jgi:hypothetical protein